MASSPSILSLIASGFYIIVSLACLGAARALNRHPHGRSKAASWVAVAVFFLILAASRVFLIENTAEVLLREYLRSLDGYEGRRPMQIGLTVTIVVIGLLTLFAFAWRIADGARRRDRDHVHLWFAFLACTMMAFLVAARLVSLHAMDAVLYGPAKINWVVDIGASLVVLLCASSQIFGKPSAGSRPRRKAGR